MWMVDFVFSLAHVMVMSLWHIILTCICLGMFHQWQKREVRKDRERLLREVRDGNHRAAARARATALEEKLNAAEPADD